MKPSPVVHFEMGYEDRERMRKFYEGAFGWKTEDLGAEMGHYVLALPGETDEATKRPKNPGEINGGFYQKTENPLSHPPSIVIAVEDIHVAMKAVEDEGGKILGGMTSSGEHTMEPTMIPNVGLWISAMDTEGNRISILQPKM